jgi:hypothetical protein
LKVVSAGELIGELVDNLKVHIWSGHAIGMVNIPPNVPDGNNVKRVGAKPFWVSSKMRNLNIVTDFT